MVVEGGDSYEGSIPEVGVVPEGVVRVYAAVHNSDLLAAFKDKANLPGCEGNDPVEVVSSFDVASVFDPVQ
ncbi:hypothetical protein V6N13_028301 [Hibiscus sabdariffa]|uniref:Uncharacterized protein n=1 Tax=Hibiscus sabdariffa TaxID=183260 RepID=A0ABR2DAT6_9ROSI